MRGKYVSILKPIYGAVYTINDLNVNARMRTEIDLNESKIDLNECEHFLKAN